MNPEEQLDPTLDTLASFLKQFGAPIEGHAREALTAEQEESLTRLAVGELDDEGRTALISLLLRNEVAMEFLAEAAS